MLSLVAIVALAAACGDDDDGGTATNTPGAGETPTQNTSGIPADVGKDDSAELTGAGATFPAPIYQAWFFDYQADVASGVSINYQSIGSGGGIEQFTSKTVDFGASDAPMSDDDLAAAPDAQHIPMVLGSVVVTYNLDGIDNPLKFDGDTLAGIYLGDITKWNDPAIAALNPGADLPDKDIQVAHRSDGSGTSYTWTDYLTKVSSKWASEVGTSKNPEWPAGQGGQGNEGVTNFVQQTPNSIGYVELSYAIVNDLPYADVKNKSGNFITPSLESTSLAAAGVDFPDDYRVSITDAPGAEAYPISTMTYLLVYKTLGDCSQQTPLAHFLWWVFHEPSATETAMGLDYAPVPEELVPRIEDTIKSLKCDGGSTPSLPEQ
jgi:phosphate transport system substrate-binding protein